METDSNVMKTINAPVLLLKKGAVLIEFKPPREASHAVVFIYEGDSEEKRMFDEASGQLLEKGAVGRAMRASTYGMSCKVKGLRPNTTYTATFSSREADEFAFGPESPRSLPIIFALPKPPAMPVIHPKEGMSTTHNARVYYSAPLSANAIKIVFKNEAGDKELVGEEQNRHGDLVIKGLEPTERYTVTAFALNSVGQSEPSPAATYRVADHVPVAPCAPDVVVLGDKEVRVAYALPVVNTSTTVDTCRAVLCFETCGKKFVVNERTGSIVPWEGEVPPPRMMKHFPLDGYTMTVNGLLPEATYNISVLAYNPCGLSPPSPTVAVTMAKTQVTETVSTSKSEVTRTRTSEESDTGLFDAADVEKLKAEMENAAPNAKESSGRLLEAKSRSGARKRAKTEAA